MRLEAYLNHPTFGLLLMVGRVDSSRELFVTLYAQRLFFLVIDSDTGMSFESIGRTEARSLVEGRLRALRRSGSTSELKQLQAAYRRTFQQVSL